MTAAILSPHPGTRCKPTLRKRLLARLHARRQHRQVEAARDDAWVVRIAPHGTVPPLVQAQARVAAVKAVTDAFNVPPLTDGFGLCEPCTIGCGGLLGCIDSACACSCRWAVTDAFNQPPAAVQPDRDVPGMEHLAAAQYSDDTHAFSRYVDGGQE